MKHVNVYNKRLKRIGIKNMLPHCEVVEIPHDMEPKDPNGKYERKDETQRISTESPAKSPQKDDRGNEGKDVVTRKSIE